MYFVPEVFSKGAFLLKALDLGVLESRIFHHLTIGLAIMSYEGYFLRANHSFCSFIGYSEDELYQMNCQEITHPDDLEENLYQIDCLKKGLRPSYQTEKRYIHKNGTIVWGLLSLTLFQDEKGIFSNQNKSDVPLYFIAQVQDITKMKEAETKLKYNEQLYRLLAENSKDVIVKRTLEGVYTYISSSCRDLLGYEPEEMRGVHYSKYIHEDDYASFEDIVSCSPLPTNFPNPFTFRFLKKDGQFIWVEVVISVIRDPKTGEPVELLSIIRNVHERMLMELQLKESEKRLRDENPEAIIIIQDDEIKYINDTGLNMLGAEKLEQLTGMNIKSFLAKKYSTLLIKSKLRLDNGLPLEINQLQLMKINGECIDVEVKAIPTIFNGLPAYYTVCIDVTELKKSRKLLQQAENLKLIGELAAGVAHEIRNPLTSIKGFIQLLIDKEGPPSIYGDVLISEIDRINMIVNELLLLAKPKKMDFDYKDFYSILDEVIFIMQPQALLENIFIKAQYNNRETYVYCVDQKLKQVFLNIIKNSIEAMPNGGTIIIEAIEEHGYLYVNIIDNGNGIPEDVLKRIGQTFLTTKEKGTGLGMMVSLSIIQDHQGYLKITSTQGKGTMVQVVLPIAEESKEIIQM